MKRIYIGFISAYLMADPLEFAKTFPLVPGDPLILDPQIKQELLQENKAQENMEIFKLHQFPWIKVSSVLLLMSLLPYMLKTLKKPTKISSPIITHPPLSELDAFSLELKKLLKSSPSLTYEEILAQLEKENSSYDLQKLNDFFKNLERLQYSQTPTKYLSDLKIDWKKMHPHKNSLQP